MNELYSKLVGFGADGTSVNSGDKNCVEALLQQKSPWLIFQWGVAHRLELALKDALQPTWFKQVDQMLTKLHSFYNTSPKKLYELKSLHKLLQNISKIYQEDDIDIVSATSALNRTKDKLQLYSNLSLQDLPVCIC